MDMLTHILRAKQPNPSVWEQKAALHRGGKRARSNLGVFETEKGKGGKGFLALSLSEDHTDS